MELLEQLISSLGKEESRAYKLFATRTGDGEGRKDLALFEKLKRSPQISFEQIKKQVFPGITPTAYYRLRNRLFSDLSRTLILLHGEENPAARAIFFLLFSRILNDRKLYEASMYHLRKAEKEAQKAYQFELLDLIYADMVRTSGELMGTDPSVFIRKRKENERDLRLLRQTDEILSMVNYRLRVTQGYSGTDGSLLTLLEETMEEFSDDNLLLRNPKLRFQIYSVVSQVLLQKKDYTTLENYLSETYSKFESEGLFNKDNHNARLQMLTYLANSAFKNAAYERSLAWAAQLKTQMEKFNRLHADKYTFFYHNVLVINYSVTDKEKAIAILEDLRKQKFAPGQEYYGIFVPLNLSILWFDLGEPKKAARYITQLYLVPTFGQSDVNLRFKIAIAEMIIRFSLRDDEVFSYRLNQVKKEFATQLKQKSNRKEYDLLNLLEQFEQTEDVIRKKKISTLARQFLKRYDTDQGEDNEIIKYRPWIAGFVLDEA